jgi:predicted AAA+ superfamily ATPase
MHVDSWNTHKSAWQMCLKKLAASRISCMRTCHWKRRTTYLIIRSAVRSFEGHCIDNLIAAAGPNRMPYYYRTHAGAELDLLFEKGGRIEMAIEIKRSSSPNPAKGFAIACDDLGITQRFVVYPGTERFALRHGAEAIGLQELAGLLRA